METLSVSNVNVMDLINISKDIAQLNLGYLGISIGILGVLGGIFIYFNVKPIKDALTKQEQVVEEMKKEVSLLLEESKNQSEELIESFAVIQSQEIVEKLQQQQEKNDLEIENKTKEATSSILDKVELISEDKDKKLKEIILSEVTNKISVLNEELTLKITKTKDNTTKSYSNWEI